MRHILSIVLVIAAALSVAACGKSDRIAPEQVPQSLKSFVLSNFGKDVKIVAAERDNEKSGFDYELTLSNGCEIDFGVNEDWIEVDAKSGTVPQSIVGDEISSHIEVAYPSATVKKIERKHYGYEVKLNNGVELMYDQAFKFIGVDK